MDLCKPKKSGFVNKKGEAQKHPDGVVCDCKQIPLYEMWEKQQEHGDVREM